MRAPTGHLCAHVSANCRPPSQSHPANWSTSTQSASLPCVPIMALPPRRRRVHPPVLPPLDWYRLHLSVCLRRLRLTSLLLSGSSERYERTGPVPEKRAALRSRRRHSSSASGSTRRPRHKLNRRAKGDSFDSQVSSEVATAEAGQWRGHVSARVQAF